MRSKLTFIVWMWFRAVKVCLAATASFCKLSHFLFYQEALVEDTLLTVPALQGGSGNSFLVPPFPIRAYSTRIVGVSWAFQNQASVSQICNAATWSSADTFSKFYQVSIQASAYVSFSCKLIQAVI